MMAPLRVLRKYDEIQHEDTQNNNIKLFMSFVLVSLCLMSVYSVSFCFVSSGRTLASSSQGRGFESTHPIDIEAQK
jgi:hypothetical protein